MNYKGDDTYKTCPGGVISLFVIVVMVLYFALKLKYLIMKEEWSIISQTMVMNPYELMQPLQLGEEKYSNITVGIQIYPKK
jgi:hypothetical protein